MTASIPAVLPVLSGPDPNRTDPKRIRSSPDLSPTGPSPTGPKLSVEFFAAMAIAFGVVFVAELGDKTQVLALTFGARYSLRVVAVGLTVGYAAANLVASIVGGLLGAALPDRSIQLVGGSVFLGFALTTMWRARHDNGESHRQSTDAKPTQRAVVAAMMTIAASIAVAEMGDKTQIATATLASQSSPTGVWIGSTLGAASSGMIGAVAGNLIGERIAPRTLQLSSAVLFAAFGVAMLAGWF